MVTVQLGMPDTAGSTSSGASEPRRQPSSPPVPVDLLILGAGWTSQFLIPLLYENQVGWAATSTTGRDNTIPFRFDPDSDSDEQYRALPTARTVLITFPLKGEGQSRRLTSLYASSRQQQQQQTRDGDGAGQTGASHATRWIQLGSTGIFSAPHWNTESSPYDTASPRAVAEDELLSGCGVEACVLNLAGLYDGASRDPRDWLVRVARTKDAVRGKGALHLVHGADVARAVLAVHRAFTPARRWIVADSRCYDWWDLMQAWGAEARARVRAGKTKAAEAAAKAGVEADELMYERWVSELMQEEGVRALPRPPEMLGRVLDSRAFWKEMGTWPSVGRV